MDKEISNPDLFDDDIKKANDGTFTLGFEPWTSKTVAGIPTLEMARRIAHVAHEAMDSYASTAMAEY